MRDLLQRWRDLEDDAREHVLSTLRSGADYAEGHVRLAGGSRDAHRLLARAEGYRVARAILSGAQRPSAPPPRPDDVTSVSVQPVAADCEARR